MQYYYTDCYKINIATNRFLKNAFNFLIKINLALAIIIIIIIIDSIIFLITGIK